MNRFTKELLALEDQGDITEACCILSPEYPRVFDILQFVIDMQSAWKPITECYKSDKELLICLLAAMSDSDIDELILNYQGE